MFLVTGSTGQLGRAVIEGLLGQVPPSEIAALARDPARAAELAARGVDVRQGDYTDYASLARAFRGIKKLLLVSTSALEGVTEQHANALRAAHQAGVRHVLFTSIASRSPAPPFRLVRDYRQTEEELIRSGLVYTILRNGYYMDMLPMFLGDALQTGQIRYPAGQGKNNFTARSDLAEAAAKVLTGGGHENRVYECCGNGAYTFHEVAEALGEAVGKRIEYVDIPIQELEAKLREEGFSQLEVELMVGIAASIRSSEGSCPEPDLEELLGRQPTELRAFFAQTYLNR
jgi:NAD(P)H dehydrogenase (quinone)